MAKVKNQNIPAQEVIYDPDPARPHTVGEAYIGTVTEGFNQPAGAGETTVERSPRQGHPSRRGPGTAAQALGRDCMKCCGDMWRNLPQYFRDCIKQLYNDRPPPPTDRQVAPDWFSTPYMMFTRLCVNRCREVGSCAFSPYELLTCPDPDCAGASIGYTTTQMHVNETQQLSIVNPHAGASYTFEIDAGGGTIDGAHLYTAPADNSDCALNASINLMCNETIVDTLEIAINTVNGDAGYYVFCSKTSWSDGTYFDCQAEIKERHLRCDGTVPLFESGCTGLPCSAVVLAGEGACEAVWPSLCECVVGYCSGYCMAGLADGCAPYGGAYDPPEQIGMHDTRSAALKLSGCCPSQLF